MWNLLVGVALILTDCFFYMFLEDTNKFSAIATFDATIVALWVGLKEEVNKLINKPKLIPKSIVKHGQSHGRQMNFQRELVFRLPVKNEGSAYALDVYAIVESICENNSLRQNFMPVPLKWTHSPFEERPGISGRNIFTNHTAYLDIASPCLNNTLWLCASVGRDIPEYSLLKNEGGDTVLHISLYQKDEKPQNVDIKINWDDNGRHDIELCGSPRSCR
ncbi:MAG: hypothetical protein HY751_06540 [Nitrospinae bacterium]|nr:hypothetical protein [Nitrospinota bacterium]